MPPTSTESTAAPIPETGPVEEGCGAWPGEDARVPRVLSIPSLHPYPLRLRQVQAPSRPRIVHLPDPAVAGADPGTWWPPVALRAEWIDDHAEQLDVVHLHFGFDSRTPEQLTRWCSRLARHRIALVLTVHDVVNPHFTDQSEHLARLDVLTSHAVAVITLTQGAAEEIRRRWARAAVVMPHPHVAPLPLVGRAPLRPRTRFRVGLHLKSLRANVVAAPVVEALVEATHDLPGAQVSVHLHREVVDPGHPRHDPDLLMLLRRLDASGRIALDLHDRHTDTQLWAYLRGLDLSVLPYAFGTHSGWVEACFDLGTPVLAPRTGFWTEQQPCATYGWDANGPDSSEIAAAVTRQYRHREARQADRGLRTAQQAQVASWHAGLYRRLATDSLTWPGWR